jgi:signal transduction histidine kinase/FixJ family two-component response regulator
MIDQSPTSHPIIYVVDDEAGIVRLCQRLLEKAGFRVVVFTQPEIAISELLKDKPIDVLLVDIRMPELDGFQVIDRTRHNHPDVAVVVMTGFGTVETAIEALRRGADGLVLKPFTGPELVQSVQRALQQSQHKQDVMRLQALKPLFSVTETLFTETSPKRLQNLVLKAVCGHLHCSYAQFYQTTTSELQDDQTDGSPKEHSRRLHLIASVHQPKSNLNIEERSTSNAFLEHIAKEANNLHSPVIVNVENPGNNKFKEILISGGLGSVMCAPVNQKIGASGVLLAARDRDDLRFRESDLELFIILARQATVALENARLNAELRDYIHQLEDSQRALIQAEKMAIAGRLTASIAHEINNPLQAVQNCLHLAGRTELQPDERKNYLNLAGIEMERLLHTVQQMLDFYRPTALDRKPEDINELINKVGFLLNKQLKDNRINIHLDLSQKIPLVLIVADQIQQVFLNILLNAMEAMPDGGDIYLETSLVERVSYSKSPATTESSGTFPTDVEVFIEDTGSGVPINERKHIFEPFFSTKDKGTGLGLAVSYGIITAHGGSLDLIDGRRHGDGSGACFRITLPITEHT